MRMAIAAADRPEARASWDRALESAESLMGDLMGRETPGKGPRSSQKPLAALWKARRATALETVGVIESLTARARNSTGATEIADAAADLPGIPAQLECEQLAGAAFEAELTAHAASLSGRAERNERVVFCLIAGNASAFLLAAGASPVVLRKIRHRMLADIDAHKNAELGARASEHDLAVTLHSIGTAVIAIDSLGRIQRLNRVAEQLTGWKQSEAVGRPAMYVLKLVDGSSDSPVSDSVAEVLRSGIPIVRGAGLELIRTDGTRRHVSENAAPIRDDNGDIHGVVIVLHDTTIPRALEARLSEVKRMKSIGRLAGGVAHEFNNLLQIILGNASLIRAMLPFRGESADYFERIDHAVQRAATITNQLLAFGGRQTLVLQNSDLSTLIERSIELARRNLPPGIAVEYEKPPVPAMARIDPSQMEQVVVNLCLHAREAMPHGGRIQIVLDEIEIGGSAGDSFLQPRIDPFFRLRISDNGVGMNDEERRRIFEPFYSSSGSALTAGLGLAAVHGIVQQHGGFVEVESVSGSGTTFTVLIPGRSDALLPAQAAQSLRGPSLRGKILIAEDEPEVRLMAQRVLERFGFEPIAAADGAEACRVFEANRNDITLALLDVSMPQIGGVEVGRLFRASNPNLPIIFCTGFSDGDHRDLKLAKPWKILRKPYKVGDLISAINRCLAGAEVPTPT